MSSARTILSTTAASVAIVLVALFLVATWLRHDPAARARVIDLVLPVAARFFHLPEFEII